jgi:hypothetical protein
MLHCSLGHGCSWDWPRGIKVQDIISLSTATGSELFLLLCCHHSALSGQTAAVTRGQFSRSRAYSMASIQRPAFTLHNIVPLCRSTCPMALAVRVLGSHRT